MKQETQQQSIERASLQRRLLDVKEALIGMNYTTIYQYEHGKLKKAGITHLRHFWNMKIMDEQILERFEEIAKKNSKNNPNK